MRPTARAAATAGHHSQRSNRISIRICIARAPRILSIEQRRHLQPPQQQCPPRTNAISLASRTPIRVRIIVQLPAFILGITYKHRIHISTTA
jgi:hypothetical protein